MKLLTTKITENGQGEPSRRSRIWGINNALLHELSSYHRNNRSRIMRPMWKTEMTPSERAEKIRGWTNRYLSELPNMGPSAKWLTLETFILAQISDAEREAVNAFELSLRNGRYFHTAYDDGFNAAREKAKGIVMEYLEWQIPNSTMWYQEHIADRIGKMEPDVSSEGREK